MRRSKSEIKNFDELITVIKKCDVCRLAINDEVYPYIIPLNFGIKLEKEKVMLYFHGALEGTKYDLLKKNNNVSFEMDCAHNLILDEVACKSTMEYESVVGHGVVYDVNEEEKQEALAIIMQQYTKDINYKMKPSSITKTKVIKLVVEGMTGKREKQDN